MATAAVGVFLSLIGTAVFPSRAASLVFTVAVCTLLVIGAAAFEGSKMPIVKISLISAMTALSVCGRVIFYPVAFFKPVSAIVIICGVCLGPVAGMICGGMSALVSGVFFGYGIWLPFQIFAWGLIGLLAGCLRRPMKKSMTLLCIFGAVSGVIFSAVMDIFTVLNFGEGFSAEMYLAAIISALPITAVYAVSNVIFLLALARPIEKKLARVLV